jgi:hypothetical protein
MRIGSVVLAFAGTNVGGRIAPALAAEPACAGVRVRGAPDLAPAWADAVHDLVVQLPPVDASACAAVTLSVDPEPGGGARLAAMAADGRYAERTLGRPAALAATALGLLASIPGDPSGAAPAGARDQPSPSPGGQIVASPPSKPSAASTAPVAHAEVWLGMAVGARVEGPNVLEMPDFEARADVFLARWVLTLSLRYAPSIEIGDSDYLYEETVLAVGAGRRIGLGRSALDVSFLPALAAMSAQWNDDDPDAQSGATTTLRLDLSARWSTPMSDSWRFTITSDADIAPTRLGHDTPLGVGAPALPVWTAGLRLGASGELL